MESKEQMETVFSFFGRITSPSSPWDGWPAGILFSRIICAVSRKQRERVNRESVSPAMVVFILLTLVLVVFTAATLSRLWWSSKVVCLGRMTPRLSFYLPSFLCALPLVGAHFSTLWTAKFRKRPPIDCQSYTSEPVEGASVRIDVFVCDAAPKAVLLMLHGLTGSSEESYIQYFASRASSRFIPVCLCNTGCAPGEDPRTWLTSKLFGGDVAATLKHLKAKYNLPIAVVGFSLGGSITANFLSSALPERDLVRVACLVSPPCDYLKNRTALEGALNLRVYNRRMTSNLIRTTREPPSERFSEYCDMEEVRASETLDQFDGRFTAPLLGFPSSDAYYRRASWIHRAEQIGTPTFVFHALDDPVCLPPPEDLPERNKNLCLVLTRVGGHLGWKRQGSLFSWVEENAVRVLSDAIEE